MSDNLADTPPITPPEDKTEDKVENALEETGKIARKYFTGVYVWMIMAVSIVIAYRRNGNKLFTWSMLLAVLCSHLYVPVILLKFLFEEDGFKKIMSATKDPSQSFNKMVKNLTPSKK
jgi:hypothetical protein